MNNNNIGHGTTVQVQRPLCYFVRSPHNRSNRGDLKSQVLLFAVISWEREPRTNREMWSREESADANINR